MNFSKKLVFGSTLSGTMRCCCDAPQTPFYQFPVCTQNECQPVIGAIDRM